MSLTSPRKKLATSRWLEFGKWHDTTCYGLVTDLLQEGSYGETGVIDFGFYAASPTHHADAWARIL